MKNAMKYLFSFTIIFLGMDVKAQNVTLGSQLIDIGSPIHYVAPVFPAGITPSNEKVRLRFTVSETGAVDPESIEVIETSNVLYNQSAADALSQFRYNPRIENGEAVPTPNNRTLIEYRVTVR